MSRRSLRVLLVLLALTVVSAAVYRGFNNELTRQDVRATARASDHAAEQALAQLGELRAAMHAYVAIGQSEDFWTSRAATLLDSLRARILQLDTAHSGTPTSELLDNVDRLAALDRRAKDYLAEGQPLLASDLIFTDARNLVEAINSQVSTVRSSAGLSAGAREGALIQDQYQLAAGALGAWIFVALLLLPRTSPPTPDEGGVLHVVPRPVLSTASSEPDLKLNDSPEPARPTPASPPPVSTERAAPLPVGAEVRVGQPSLPALAAVCSDLARVTDAAGLDPLLDRAASALEASGLIVWMAASDGTLQPAAAHGYDARLLSRLGPVSQDAGNLTASVFRDGTPRGAPASETAPAAVVVPLVGASGAIGVLAAELRPAIDMAAATSGAVIVAAQLAALLATPAQADAEPSAIRRVGA
jgi:hypothetical protein